MIITKQQDLLQPCEDVQNLTEGRKIVDKLVLELRNEKTGIGLAAPQIGIFKKVFVALKQNSNEFFGFINPEIVSLSEPFIFRNEGCLSFPGQFVDTIRYRSVKVKDLECPQGDSWTDEMAVIIQHECDHLNMKTMFDHVVPDKYDDCFCGSGNKFKFCCSKIL